MTTLIHHSPSRRFGISGILLACGVWACAGTEADTPASSNETVEQATQLYTTSAGMRPTNFTINLVASTQPIHNNFTRHVAFTDHTGAIKRVALDFVRTSSLHYSGTIAAADLPTLQSLVEQDNRSFWDSMAFENRGGTTPLSIASLELWIEYANHAGQWEPEMMIGYAANKQLAAGTDSFAVDNATGRQSFARSFLGWTSAQLTNTPAPFQSFVKDLGKGGSDDDFPANGNPKYGLSGDNLCSETVSWYYYNHGVTVTDTQTGGVTNFKDIVSHATMHDAFKNAGRLYCYHLGAQAWVKRDRSYNWVVDAQGNYVTYAQPKAGDYLDRRPTSTASDNGHAMMIAKWQARSGTAGGIATVIDGPFPVAFRTVPVHDLEANGTDFCVGRIPAND